jgi:hypothetical protein
MTTIFIMVWVAFFGYATPDELSDEQWATIEAEAVVTAEKGG